MKTITKRKNNYRKHTESKNIVQPKNLELLFMYQELLGRGLQEWKKKKNR